MSTSKVCQVLFALCLACGLGCGGAVNLPDDEATADDERYYAAAVERCDTTASLIKNGDFSTDLTSWTTEIHEYPSATISAVTDSSGNSYARVRNSKVQDFYKVQIWQALDKLERDHCYRLCFRAKASGSRQIQASVMKNAPPWGDYGLWLPQPITKKWAKYSTRFWARATASDARLSFTFGDSTAEVQLDDVILNDMGDISTCASP